MGVLTIKEPCFSSLLLRRFALLGTDSDAVFAPHWRPNPFICTQMWLDCYDNTLVDRLCRHVSTSYAKLLCAEVKIKLKSNVVRAQQTFRVSPSWRLQPYKSYTCTYTESERKKNVTPKNGVLRKMKYQFQRVHAVSYAGARNAVSGKKVLFSVCSVKSCAA